MGDVTPGQPLIGMGTRFAPNKGVREFIEAIPFISRYLPGARFVLAGEGPLLGWAQDYAAQLGVEDKIAFPGFIRDMFGFWGHLDFALFTCPRESFGLSIAEPQAAGTVVAGYRNGSGSDEIIVPGETGIMVPWGRQEELARELAALWSDPARYAQIAGAARLRLQTHFSLRNMSTQSIELYEHLIG
jgi:glycosyltransferase involved in cell wall biosynthesis